MSVIQNKRKLVSVIIPFYNRIGLLKASVQSVIRQSYKPIELILVDDHSEEIFDRDFIKDYTSKEFRIKIIRNEKNIGPGLAREAGRLIAKGDYFAYLDSDDFWHEEFLEKLVSCLENNKSVGMAYSKTILIRTTGNFLRNKNDKSFDKIVPVLFDVHGRPWATGACLWKREIVNKIGSWSNARIWEDYEYDVRAAIVNNKIIHIPEVLFYVNMDSKEKISLVKNTTKMIADKANSILNIAKNLRKSKFFQDKDIRKRMSYYLLTSCATLSDNNYNKSMIRNLFKEYYFWKGNNFFLVNAVTSLAPPKINSKIYRKIRQLFVLIFFYCIT
ncbi:MAG: glycosyltransferase family 2 protein [Ignavibacteria bacterium]